MEMRGLHHSHDAGAFRRARRPARRHRRRGVVDRTVAGLGRSRRARPRPRRCAVSAELSRTGRRAAARSTVPDEQSELGGRAGDGRGCRAATARLTPHRSPNIVWVSLAAARRRLVIMRACRSRLPQSDLNRAVVPIHLERSPRSSRTNAAPTSTRLELGRTKWRSNPPHTQAEHNATPPSQLSYPAQPSTTSPLDTSLVRRRRIPENCVCALRGRVRRDPRLPDSTTRSPLPTRPARRTTPSSTRASMNRA